MSALAVVTPAKYLQATSSLVRRLIHPNRGSAKKRICHWLSEIGEMQLLQFGVTLDEIAMIRREQASMCKGQDDDWRGMGGRGCRAKNASVAATTVVHEARPARPGLASQPPKWNRNRETATTPRFD